MAYSMVVIICWCVYFCNILFKHPIGFIDRYTFIGTAIVAIIPIVNVLVAIAMAFDVMCIICNNIVKAFKED